jgi:hypothetical protein
MALDSSCTGWEVGIALAIVVRRAAIVSSIATNWINDLLDRRMGMGKTPDTIRHSAGPLPDHRV